MTVPAGMLPARALPLLYLGTAHLSLALACLFAACWPEAVAGFFYHAWLIGLVHMITLGWISFSILGAIYIAGPLALRMDMRARRMDYVAYACAVIGLAGMVGHFWIQRYGGMAWSAAAVASAILYMTTRIAVTVRAASIQPAVKLHVVFACANFWLAASMGLLIAFDKVAHFLPGFVIANVFAHAHLAALGWATMMVVGVGYRMLPMTFPSKMPAAGSMYASAVLLEIGVLGLVGFLAQMVVAMEARLLPMATWFWTYAATGYRVAPPSPHVMRERWLQAIVFAGWTLGVPALAGGMFLESAGLVRVGASALFAGVALGFLDNAFVVTNAFTAASATRTPRAA